MSRNNFRLAYLGLLLLMLTSFGCSSGKAFKSGVTYKCDEEKRFVVDFYDKVDIVFLTVREKTFSLHRMSSASGIKYSDGNTTFWIKGDTAFVETNGRTEFNNCSAEPK